MGRCVNQGTRQIFHMNRQNELRHGNSISRPAGTHVEVVSHIIHSRIRPLFLALIVITETTASTWTNMTQLMCIELAFIICQQFKNTNGLI